MNLAGRKNVLGGPHAAPAPGVVHSPSEQAEHSDFAHNAVMEALN
jgi:hypothetical protein